MSFDHPTVCAWCAPDNKRPATGSALGLKSVAAPIVYRRFPSCGLFGHGAEYETGFLALNRQTLRTEQAANAYAEALRELGQRIHGLEPEHLYAMEAALLVADGFQHEPRLPTPRNYLVDPATSYRVKRAAELGARDARAMAEGMGFPYLPERVLQHAAEAALGHLMESLDVVKDQQE